MRRALILIAFATAAVAPVIAQMPTTAPGAADASRVKAGNYKVDSPHTIIAWEVDHLGFNPYYGLFGNISGTMTLDPANLAKTSVNITIPIADVATTSAGLTKHLMTPDFFDMAKFGNATFVSTRVTPSGTNAKIEGNLTLRGVTKPVVLDARFTGAGDNPMSKANTVGFEAKTSIKRSDFGVAYGIPMVGDKVDLKITVAFERQA
jgi:polyisoprenoid-binding protein YceI